MSSSLTFHGAAGTVTGSRSLIEAKGQQVLVDCGSFPGPRNLRLREPEASEALRRRIQDELGWTCVVPEPFQRAVL
ncbi:hypothetical protein [Alsobacter sp. R-9]